MQSIVEYLAYYAEKTPENDAVIANGEKLTFKELWNSVRNLSAYLKEHGIRTNDKVLVKGAHTVQYAVCCYAVHLCGAVLVPVERNLPPKGIAEIIDRVNGSFVISNEKPECEVGFLPETELQNIPKYDNAEPSFPTIDMSADILFTTGTTGKSKGVELTHRNLLSMAEKSIAGTEMAKDNVYLVTVPMNHAGGIRKLHMSIVNGSTTVLLNGFMNLKLFFQTIEEYKITSIYLPPAAVRLLIGLAGEELKKYDKQLRFIYTGSAAFPEGDKEKLCEILPSCRLYNGYGGSEIGSVSMFDYNRNKGMINCIGKPNEGVELIITDESRNPIVSSPENTGIIAVKSDMNMKGYYNDPELTAKAKIGDYIFTSDLGYIDKNGYVFMVGRAGDVINIGGLKVAPTEVEEIALRYDGIKDCACCCVDDRRSSKAIKLLIVPKENYIIDSKEIRKFLSEYLETYKIPKIIETVSEIPRTYNGKIDRKKLA